MQLSPAEQDALVRYRPGAGSGHVESYYLKLNLPGSRALWLRLALVERAAASRKAEVEATALAFNLPSPGQHVALRSSWPYREARVEHDCFFIRVADVLWRQGHTSGVLEGADGLRLTWDLSYQTADRGFRHVRRGPSPAGKACSPQLDTRCQGTVTCNGVSIDIDGAPGMLGHAWGPRRGELWAWSHCNAWDDADRVVFEGGLMRLKLGPVASPLLALVHVRIPGERLTLNGLVGQLRARRRLDQLAWEVQTNIGDRYVEARFSAPAERFLCLRERDPDGQVIHCLRSPLARAEVTVSARDGAGWRELVRATSRERAALEIGDRESCRGVPVYGSEPDAPGASS